MTKKMILILTLFAGACGASAQNSPEKKSVDLSTDGNVIEQLQKIVDAKNLERASGDEKLLEKIKTAGKLKPENVCIERLKESKKIIVIGFFRYDYGCHLEGAFVDSHYYEATEIVDLSKAALEALGWNAADQKERERLALVWVEKGLNAFFTVLYTKPKELENAGFQPPQTNSTANGDVTVSFWVQLPQGRTKEKGFQHFLYKFKPDGSLSSGTTLAAVVAE